MFYPCGNMLQEVHGVFYEIPSLHLIFMSRHELLPLLFCVCCGTKISKGIKAKVKSVAVP